MTTAETSRLNVSRLRGVDAARSAVIAASPAGMQALARSLAHEVVDRMEIPDLGDESCGKVAGVWGAAARGGDRDQAIFAVVDWIQRESGMSVSSGLRDLGFDSWDELAREAVGIQGGEAQEGVDMLAELVQMEAEAISGSRALEAIPASAMVEMSYIPQWDGVSADTAIEALGMRFLGPEGGVGSVECGPQLVAAMRFFNIAMPDLLAAVQKVRPQEYEGFAVRVAQKADELSIVKSIDYARPALMSAEDFIDVIENASDGAIPNISFQIRLKSLLACDPAQEIVLRAKGNKYHVGCREGFINGSGYMDTFEVSEPVSIDLTSGVLINESRWNSSLSDVYWHVKSEYRVEPSQPSDDQLDFHRFSQRVAA